MVHGGGHHHSGGGGAHHQQHSSSGTRHHYGTHSSSNGGGWNRGGWGNQWGWWGSPPINQNVGIINNREQSSYRNYRAAAPTQQSGECCRKFCLGCCTCCFITAASSEPHKCGPLVHWIFLSLCFFILLVVMSNVNETWTLNKGETRRIQTKPILTTQVEIQSQVANGIMVYDISGKCPSLTGSPVSLNETWRLHLAPDDYQYDYYHLTKGSTLSVNFKQHRGATDISILKGKSQLHAVESGEDFPSFASQAVLTRYTAAALCEHDKCHHHSPPVSFDYVIPESDVYIIVYDNASSFVGRARATIHVDLATYNLANQVPFDKCQALSCTVDTKRGECLLLQAPTGAPIVTVHITAKRRWLAITAIALVPVMIALVLRVLRRHQESAEVMPPATNPEAPLLTERSDATADYESIPIITSENVVPVAVPILDAK